MRNERGTVAVVAAVSMTMLFGMGAMSVDLGNAFARKRDLQAQADFAALAGADKLGAGNTYAVTDEAVKAVRDYLNDNKPGTYDPEWTNVTAADLIDDSDHVQNGSAAERNGEVYFLSGDRMKVVAPDAMVNVGLGEAIGFNDFHVASEATVQIRSGGGVMPFFAVEGCDYGPQTISDPPPGPATSLNLALATPDSNADPDNLDKTQVALNATPAPSLTVTGSQFTGGADVTQIGFFRNDGATYVTAPLSEAVTSTTAKGVIPSAVLAVEDVWWVRVLKGTKWSPVNQALPLKVGAAVLECAGAALEGNFGSLKLPRKYDNPADWLAINIAKGLEPPLSLDKHDGASGPSWTCTDGVAGAKASRLSPPDPVAETNCVDTDTGLPAAAATAGFITGGTGASGAFAGRLNVDTTPGCGGGSDRNARRTTPVHTPPAVPGGFYKINDDLLTCFFTNDTTTINQISQNPYTGGVVISPAIYNSPRFFFQPVLGTDPACGTCNQYSIVGFRPGFITDQSGSATRLSTTPGTTTDYNGLSFNGGGTAITKIKVVFFNIGALPPPDENTPTVAYMGFGPKAIRLVD